MGLLKVGSPLSWSDLLQHCRYIRENGIRQFLATWDRTANLENELLFYGDEIEYGILRVDRQKRTVQISLRSDEILQELRLREASAGVVNGRSCTWHQEYGSWMIESTPGAPYSGFTSSLLEVEQNMRLRRGRLLSVLLEDEIAPTLVNFPLFGVGDFVHPMSKPGGTIFLSDAVPDAVINAHPRFGTLTRNIRTRRGSKVDIQIPAENEGEPPIKMDCMAYGMGCCCLQVTFQASDVNESRYLYDQMAVLSPIFLALTAATPIHQGRLAGTDARWNTIAASVDDRTPEERGEAAANTGAANGSGATKRLPDKRMVGEGVRRLSKSRYDSISCYIDEGFHVAPDEFNDVECEVDEEMRELLLNEGADDYLARHLAHLFVRDPLVAFEGAVEEVDNNTSTEHFDSINSTNWQTVRWKPPPPTVAGGPHIGWRTEFRPMEVQPTDFENAAFTAFIVLVTRALLVFDLTILVPLSKVDENMSRAHEVDAVNKQKFWFRKSIIPDEVLRNTPRHGSQTLGAIENDAKLPSVDYEEMTMHEIINGKGTYFPGLVPLCLAYLEHIQCDITAFPRIQQYLCLVARRASGELLTPATWMRRLVKQHPKYNGDSVVSPEIAYDLVTIVDEVGRGQRSCPDLHGELRIEPIVKEGSYPTPLGSSTSQEARAKLEHLLVHIRKRASPEDGGGSLPSCPLRRRISGECTPITRETSGRFGGRRQYSDESASRRQNSRQRLDGKETRAQPESLAPQPSRPSMVKRLACCCSP